MSLSDIPVVVLVFAASWLAAPLIYALDKLAAMEDPRWIFAAGVITLPLFGLICTILAKNSQGKEEPLFYGKLFTNKLDWYCPCDLIYLKYLKHFALHTFSQKKHDIFAFIS